MLPQAVLALAWLVHEPLDRILDGPRGALWAGWADPVCWLLIIWFSLSTHALRGVLINKGQVLATLLYHVPMAVRPSDATLLHAFRSAAL